MTHKWFVGKHYLLSIMHVHLFYFSVIKSAVNRYRTRSINVWFIKKMTLLENLYEEKY